MGDESIELEKDASNQMKEEKLQLGSFPEEEEEEEGKSQAGIIRLQYKPRRCGKHQHQPSSRQREYCSTSTSIKRDKDKRPNRIEIGRSSSINSSSSSQSRVCLNLGEFQCADPR